MTTNTALLKLEIICIIFSHILMSCGVVNLRIYELKNFFQQVQLDLQMEAPVTATNTLTQIEGVRLYNFIVILILLLLYFT